MELKYSPLSPYVRKVMLTAHEIGIADRIRFTPVNTREEPEKIAPFNPLGKIPALVTDDGAVLFDSPVICEYLDAEFGQHRLLPAAGARRWEILTQAALADGMLDATLLIRNEHLRPAALRSPDWMALQLRKVNAGLDHMERTVGSADEALDLGKIALGAALGYMPLRLVELEGLPRWPRLKAWFDAVSQRESFRRTTPVV